MTTEKRLIDANALDEHIKDLPTWWADDGGFYGGAMKYPEGMFIPEDIISSIENAPTVDAVEVVHGRWVEVRSIQSVNRKDVPVVKCSKCEIYFCDLINNHHYMYHYCPNCGAKMDGDN